MPVSHTFERSERLKSAKIIGSLFRGGNSFAAYPLRVVWAPTQAGPAGKATMAVSVSKKRFKTAVERNRVKRLVREAYRLHKHLLYEQLENREEHISIMVSYIGQEILTYQEVERGVLKMFRKLEESHKQKQSNS
ncbi:MAG: ribonuclease P protein component [Bacteroidota bacterium]|jgi:ribonuclease P protein component